jgi:hypothetical protein
MIIVSILLAAVAGNLSKSAENFISQRLHVTSYKSATADLNGDGRLEVFIYATDADSCGSGGCTLFVLSPRGGGYRVVMRSTIVQLPIRVLATKSYGWRDVGVTVAGGGILRAYMAKMRFNGRRYPSNPSVPPAVPARPSGRVLLGR